MILTIIKRPNNGILGGPKENQFSIHHNNADYDIEIKQGGERIIVIRSSDCHSYEAITGIYYGIETLLMLFDGQFYPVVSAFENDSEITHCWKRRELPSYQSADFVLGAQNRLLDFESFLNVQIVDRWMTLRTELDIIHNMALYCLSNVQMPIDMKCAFMIEVFEGLSELIKSRVPTIRFPIAHKGESQLQKYLSTFVLGYGQSIFADEIQLDVEKFTQILVDTRNKISHIKSKQNRVYLDDSESVMYLMKLSLLYRVVLFALLGIDKHAYEDNLAKRVQAINAHNVMQNFLKKLGKQNN